MITSEKKFCLIFILKQCSYLAAQLTKAYSSRAKNTKVTQRLDQTSIAFVYATGGKELFIEDVVVDIARSVVTVRATLAGA